MLDAGMRSPGSRPSTWSLPVMPRAASRTTRNSAVSAKPITRAVRTRAWGTGSAIRDASAPASSTGGAPTVQPAHGEDEQVHGVAQQREAEDDLEGARPQEQPDARGGEDADAERQDELHQAAPSRRSAPPRLRPPAARRSDWWARATSISDARADHEDQDAEVEHQGARHRHLAEQRRLPVGEVGGEERAAEQPGARARQDGDQQADADPGDRADAQALLHPLGPRAMYCSTKAMVSAMPRREAAAGQVVSAQEEVQGEQDDEAGTASA